MKPVLPLFLLVLCSPNVFSQTDGIDQAIRDDELLIKKRILVHDFENQLKSIKVAAVRVFARYSIASWLLKDGKDETGRAGDLLVDAAEDLVSNRSEIPSVYSSSLWSNLRPLLDRHKPEDARRIRAKYERDLPDRTGTGSYNALLRQPGGDKLAADEAIRNLLSGSPIDFSVANLLDELRQRRSSHFSRLAEAIVAAEESVRTRSSPASYVLLLSSLHAPSVPLRLENRFLRVVVNRCLAAGQSTNPEISAYFDLLGRILPILSEKHPDLVPAAGVANSVLTSRISREAREERERNERIGNSPDKLAAIVWEAEQATDPVVRYELYRRAARLALEQKKFSRSVDLMKLASDIDMSSNAVPEQIRRDEYNQFLSTVITKSLEGKEPESAGYALKILTDPVRKADGFTLRSKYFNDSGERLAAIADVDSAIGISANIESLPRRASALLKMLALAHAIDSSRVYEINRLAASAINKLPTTTVDEKKEPEEYRDYVTQIMVINWNLFPALASLAKVDPNGASDLAGRIEKKEIRIVADFVIARSSFELDKGSPEKGKVAQPDSR